MGRKRHPEPLTPAEQRVLQELRTGATNPEIAVRLGLSINTVKYHVANMLAKTGLDDRAALARWQMPREPGRWAGWGMRAAVAAGAVAVVATGLLIVALFYQSAQDRQVWIAYAISDSGSGESRLVALELTSGTRRDLRAAQGWSLRDALWSPTGDHLLAKETNLATGASRLVIFHRDGWGRSLIESDFFRAIWAPDGSAAVTIGLDHVTLLRPDGSVVASQADHGAVLSVSSRAWSPDSRSFVAFRGPAALPISSAAGEFWRVDDELQAIGVGSGYRFLPLGWTADSRALILAATADPPLPMLALRVEPSTRTVTVMAEEDYRLALSNREIEAPTAVGQDGRWLTAVAQVSTEYPAAPPRLVGETVDGRGLVFASGNPGEPVRLIVFLGAGAKLLAGTLESFDETMFSVVLTGDWPSPASATAATTPP